MMAQLVNAGFQIARDGPAVLEEVVRATLERKLRWHDESEKSSERANIKTCRMENFLLTLTQHIHEGGGYGSTDTFTLNVAVMGGVGVLLPETSDNGLRKLWYELSDQPKADALTEALKKLTTL